MSQPQAARAAFTHGLIGKWVFLCRTCGDISQYLQPLEDLIHQKFVPALTGHECDTPTRKILALPARHGGLGLSNPVKMAHAEYKNSRHISAPLSDKMVQQETELETVLDEVLKRRRAVKAEKRKDTLKSASSLRESLPRTLQRCLDVASEKGASNWLSCMPLQRHGFVLHKSAFRDAICLRYGWQPDHLPSSCVCGKNFSVAHAMSCPSGGYPTIRHNEVRNVTASLLRDVCTDVTIEPTLQPLHDEVLHGRTCNREDGARLDISARGFWGERFCQAFFDVRVFCPFATTNLCSLEAAYKRHEAEKRRAYGQRVEVVERSSFTPLVFSTSGGIGKAANVFYRRLGGLLADKHKTPYSSMMAWVRTRMSFALLRSALLCLRGWRSRPRHRDSVDVSSIAVAISEAGLV